MLSVFSSVEGEMKYEIPLEIDADHADGLDSADHHPQNVRHPQRSSHGRCPPQMSSERWARCSAGPSLPLKRHYPDREALQAAVEIQQSFLPRPAPRIPQLDIHALLLYSEKVGGDYHDFRDPDDPADDMALMAIKVNAYQKASAKG
jgi:hypothetical protein